MTNDESTTMGNNIDMTASSRGQRKEERTKGPGSDTYISTDQELSLVKAAENKDREMVPISEVKDEAVREMVQFLPEDMRKTYSITRKAVRLLSCRLRHIRHGGTLEIPMMCPGSTCPMALTCPLLAERCAPIGKICPIEKYLAESLRAYYIKDLSVDVNNFVYMTQVNDLVECEILDQRMTAYLGKEGWIDDVVVGVDGDGKPIFRKDEAIPLKIKMRMKSRKDKLLKSFLATREMRAKYNLTQRKDPSSYAAELLERAERLKQDMGIEDVDVEEVEDTNA